MSLENPNKKEWKKFYKKNGVMDKVSYLNHRKKFRPYFKTIKKYVKKGSIIEIGCGPAKLGSILSRDPSYSIILTDTNMEMLKKAEINVQQYGDIKNVQFAQLDCFKLLRSPLLKDKKHDAIVHHGLLEHFREKDILEILSQQIKAGRFVIFGVPYFTKKNVKLWYRTESIFRNGWRYNHWKNFLKKHFNVIDLFRFNAGSDNFVCVISQKS